MKLKESFVNFSLNYLKNNNACDSKNEKIYRYTLESIYSFTTKSLVILLLSILLGTFKITIITLLLYSILRGFSFGIHATKNLYCWMISLSVYIVVPLIIKIFLFSQYVVYAFYSLGILAILLWAPSDTKARPLINKNKRIVNKIISLLFAILLIVVSYFSNITNSNEIVACLLLINSVCICPFTYYIFKQPYRNYRFYIKTINKV